MSFRITGLDPQPFSHLFGQPDAVLEKHGVVRYLVDSKPGFPDRVELRDTELGDTALLLNYEHLPLSTPYRSSHAIFVREWAAKQAEVTASIPDMLRVRLLSVRAFDANGMMLDADVVDGLEAAALFAQLLGDPAVAFLHVHTAKRGCFLCRVDRA